MSILKKNVIANFIGEFWSALLAFIFIPVYLYYLGVEAYGLIGLFASLRVIFDLLDMGLSKTLINSNEDLAITPQRIDLAQGPHNVLRTLEIAYIIIGLFIIFTLVSASDFIAYKWLNLKQLDAQTVRWSVIVFALSLAFSFQLKLYNGVLLGLDRQVLFNCIRLISVTLYYVGSAIVIIFICRSIIACLIWQLFIILLEVLVNAYMGWKLFHPYRGKPAVFKFSILRSIWKFNVGVVIISVFIAFLKQTDKVVMSKILPLEYIGYYVIAGTIYNRVIALITNSFSRAIFPRMSTLATKSDMESLANTYHNATKLLMFIVAPISAVFCFFSYELLLCWTQSEIIALNAALVLSILACAGMLNSAVYLIYTLQLSGGITRISFWVNLTGIICLIPLIYIFSLHFGIIGGAYAWLFFSIVYYFVVPWITHRYILKGHFKIWILKDTIPSMFLSFIIFGIIYLLKKQFSFNLPVTFMLILLGGAAYLFSTVLLDSYVKKVLFSSLRFLKIMKYAS